MRATRADLDQMNRNGRVKFRQRPARRRGASASGATARSKLDQTNALG